MDGRKNGWMDGWMDRQVDRHIYTYIHIYIVCNLSCGCFNLFCNMWMCVCVAVWQLCRCFGNCVDVLVICVHVFTVYFHFTVQKCIYIKLTNYTITYMDKCINTYSYNSSMIIS